MGHVVADVIGAPSMLFPAASRPEAPPRQDAGFVPEFSRCRCHTCVLLQAATGRGSRDD